MLTRRRVLVLLTAAGAGSLFVFLQRWVGFDSVSAVVRKVVRRLHRQPLMPPEEARTIVEFPAGGNAISVETALNSRCMSDFDGLRIGFHWGLFDPRKKCSPDQISEIADYVRTARCWTYGCDIRASDNLLMTVVDSRSSGVEREWRMVESGMQQQAIALTCAALGVGVCFMNMGPEGEPLSETETGTIRTLINPMRPSYGADHWARHVPTGLSGWLRGNLPDPRRDGTVRLLEVLKNLRLSNHGGDADLQSLSQVLWAARGRTPHLYKSTPWGMTIPTAMGIQGKSTVLVASESGLSEYVNWRRHRPTHSLCPVSGSSQDLHAAMRTHLPDSNIFLMLKAEKPTTDTLWEIGYQLLNILLQASALGLAYRTVWPDDRLNVLTRGGPAENTAAIVGLRSTSGSLLKCRRSL